MILSLKANNWYTALEYGKLRLISIIASDYFSSLLQNSKFKFKTKSIDEFVYNFCSEKNTSILSVQMPLNLNNFLNNFNFDDKLKDLNKEFRKKDFTKILKKIFTYGYKSKIGFFFEDFESDKPSLLVKLTVEKKNIFRVICDTTNIKIAKQITSLTFLSYQFSPFLSFYIDKAAINNFINF